MGAALRSLSCVAALVLSACASAPVPSTPAAVSASAAAPAAGVPTGTWVGSLRIDAAQAADEQEPVFMVLYACGTNVRYYMRNSETGRFNSPQVALSVASHHGLHHLRFFDWHRQKADDWVETQGLDFVEVDATHARGWWTRTINNRDLPADHARRTIHAHGVASFKRHSAECPREAGDVNVETIFVPPDPDKR